LGSKTFGNTAALFEPDTAAVLAPAPAHHTKHKLPQNAMLLSCFILKFVMNIFFIIRILINNPDK
jgi:hypothetical protein